MRRRGFTLIELLMVIGIIAVLAGIVLTVSTKSRGGANRAICTNNLHQLAIAMLAYAQDNDGRFPAHGNVGVQVKEDWIYWMRGDQVGSNDPWDLLKSPINKYLKSTTAAPFICPADDRNDRLRHIGPPYQLSYTMNMYFSSASPLTPQKLRLSAIVEPSQKMMMMEEDEISIDDGNFHPELLQGSLENFLGTRHDKRRKDWTSWNTRAFLARPDRNDRGNAAFADGHVDYITRADTWQKMHYEPFHSYPRDPNR